ncbi:hypothetical protein OIDMADRAFT_130539 [Oidiodendron maius Zn]|uniref:DUF6594 domain-containing protein n=1 Tax=Oidiodendron maius (strain Zn) TaxID=913774 RepID=A0A0C3D617_OIDMZ|nr:hypothetical protein OIDMADRAFT_130539 [Oidiodendron maius Zn]
MEGYEKLAQLMGNSHTDGHFLIFQKFAHLSARNLLYLQAEIVTLEETLSEFAKEDAESEDPERQKSQHQMISNLPQPHKSDLKFLQSWLDRPSMGNCSLVGTDRRIYETNISGLGTLAPASGEVDPLTRLLLYSLPKLYHWGVVDPLHRLFESFDLESNIFLYRDSHFYHAAKIIGTLISSLIPIGSTVVLYFVKDMPTRLGIVCLFTAIFSIALSSVTSGTRVEIFAATAAFASVQVVFIGSTTSQ